jgi:hypothetical protein
MRLGSRKLQAFERRRWDHCQVDGNVENGEELERDAQVQRSSTAEEVDEKESAQVSRAELDHAENAGGEELLRLTGLAQCGEELCGVDGDGTRS